MLNNYDKIISSTLTKILNNAPEKKQWIYCGTECIKNLIPLLKHETDSTLYMLNILSNSLLTINNAYIYFEINNLRVNFLNGIWNDDKKYFKMMISDQSDRSGTKPRLIMGFGPSGSDKTPCAIKIIDILCNSEPIFPKSFVSIDSNIYIQKSKVYQEILKFIRDSPKKKNVIGLKNMVVSPYKRFIKSAYRTLQSIFDTDLIKPIVCSYLEAYKDKISLYVPETLSSCESNLSSPESLINTNCESLYQKYKDLTGDKLWIGLFIYQHLTSAKCDFDDSRLKCEGCEKSGKDQEKKNGIKYNSKNWYLSFNNAREQVNKALGGYIFMHNSGSDDRKSTILKSSFKLKLNKDYASTLNCIICNKNIELVPEYSYSNYLYRTIRGKEL